MKIYYMAKIKKNIYDIKELGFVPPNYGGVSVSIERLINALEQDGFKVGGFYHTDNKNKKYLSSPLFEKEPNFSTKYILFNYHKIKKILNQYKIIHSHYGLEHMIYIWCFQKLMKKKVVITIHNSMVTSFYRKSDFLNRFFLKKNFQNSNITWIAVSNQTKTEMLKIPVDFNNKIHVIPAYIPIKSSNESLQKEIQDYIKKHDKSIVFYAHSFMRHEGIDVYGINETLRLYAELKIKLNQRIGLIFCLAEENNLQEIAKLKQKANDLKIDKYIYWQIGPIQNMGALWDAVDIYIRPTSTDGDSVAIREALNAGVRVVASDVCKRPEKVLVYKFKNGKDFLEKTLYALENGKEEIKPDFSNYYKLKGIYTKLLKT